MLKLRRIAIIISIILILPTLVSSGCSSCESQSRDTKNNEGAMKYKLIAIASILVASLLGVCLPFLVKKIPALDPERDFYMLIKAMAAGVILATGFIHILPDAFDSLTSPCLGKIPPWGRFPFAGFVAMMTAIGTLMLEAFATSYHKRSQLRKPQPLNSDDHHEADAIQASAFVLDQSNSSQLTRRRIISQVLELGIVVHSVIIGVSLGVSQRPKTIKPLIAALSFHQFFEGMGLGGCISQAKFKHSVVAFMIMFFSFTTPSGIAMGIGISNIYNENSPTALIVQGILNSASAGILIYMALVDLLAVDYMDPKMQNNIKLQLGANFTLLVGACCMSLLALWE